MFKRLNNIEFQSYLKKVNYRKYNFDVDDQMMDGRN